MVSQMGEVVPQLTGANVAFAVRARVCLLRDLGAPLHQIMHGALFKA